MKILHVLLTRMPIPPENYGGTERVLWALYQGQTALGHEVRFLTKSNPTRNPVVQVYDAQRPLHEQIDDWPDMVHFHWPYDGQLNKPFVCTEHSNWEVARTFPINTIYLSRKHAENHGAQCYVHNGLYWPDYGEPNLQQPGEYVHFLAKASWRIKNLQGTVRIAQAAGRRLEVLGGTRLNIRRNPYFFASPRIRFHGMVGGEKKNALIRQSAGLVFPVLWHEPFGLAVTESMYLGCPVIASPYGSLPDIVSSPEVGVISDHYEVLIEAVRQISQFDRRACHEHARQHFSHLSMSKAYLDCYEKVLAGETLNSVEPSTDGKAKQSLTMV